MYIREFLNMDINQIRALPMQWIEVESDVDKRWVNPRELELSWSLWGPLRNKLMEQAKLNTGIILDYDKLNAKHVIAVVTEIVMLLRGNLWVTPPFAEQEGRTAYEITNELYNYAVTYLSPWITSTSIFDFIEAASDPEIQAIKESVHPNEASINEGYEAVAHALRHSPALATNKLSFYARKELVPVKQIMQCIYNIGFRTDIDGRIFKKPCLDGYLHGVRELADSMAESRTASTSMLLTESPLQDTEYLNRRVDLHSMYVRRIEYVDCGNDVLMEIPAVLVNTKFNSLLGKEVLLNGARVNLRPEHKSLVKNNPLRVRSVAHCRNADPSNVCIRCYGELGLSYPEYSNIGHIAETEAGSLNAQAIMSFKHFVGSAAVSPIDLESACLRFLTPSEDNLGIKLSPAMRKHKFRIVVDAKLDAKNLGDINQVDVGNLDIFKVTSLTYIIFYIYDAKGELHEQVKVPMRFGSRNASFSNAALQYLKSHPWGLTEKGNYIMDFSDWDYKEKLFALPMKHDDPTEYITALAKVLISGGDKAEGGEKKFAEAVADTTRYRGNLLRALSTYTTKEEAIIALFALTNTSNMLNIVHCEVIVKAYLNKSPTDKRLPRGDEDYIIGQFSGDMSERSFGPAMAYQNQLGPLTNIANYIRPAPDGHPMDQLLEG